MRGLLSLAAMLIACLLCSSTSAQDCINGQCQVRRVPTLAPPLPNVQAVVRSVVELQPIRRSAYAVVGTAYRVARSPVRVVRRIGIVRRAVRGMFGCR